MYRLVDTGAWDDPWFSELPPEGKLLFLYLLTNRRTNSVGAYEITERQIVFETGMADHDVQYWLQMMTPRVQWWPEHRIVWVKNFYGRQNNGEKIEVNARRIVTELPDEVCAAVCMAYPELVPDENAPCIPHAYPMDKQNVTGTETTTEQDGTERNTAGADAPLPASAPAGQKKVVERMKRIPDDWALTDELRSYAVKWGIPASEVDEFAGEFKRYWKADGRKKLDWDLTFMGRVRDQAHRYQGRASPQNGREELGFSAAARQVTQMRGGGES